jgi:hemerythrin
MLLIREEAVARMRRDHAGMIELIRRIQGACTQPAAVDNCNHCPSSQRELCGSEIEQLLRAFVEATLKHNVIESLYMEQGVPAAHRQAHNRAHQRIAERLKTIRVVLAGDGNCVLAVNGIDEVLAELLAHFSEFDEQLERYLLTAG